MIHRTLLVGICALLAMAVCAESSLPMRGGEASKSEYERELEEGVQSLLSQSEQLSSTATHTLTIKPFKLKDPAQLSNDLPVIHMHHLESSPRGRRKKRRAQKGPSASAAPPDCPQADAYGYTDNPLANYDMGNGEHPGGSGTHHGKPGSPGVSGCKKCGNSPDEDESVFDNLPGWIPDHHGFWEIGQ